jgi:hypothetical protein
MKKIIFLWIILLILLIFIFLSKSSPSSSKSPNPNIKDIKVGLVCMMRKPKNIEQWLDHHKSLGISHFYIRLEDTPELEQLLSNDPSIKLQIGSSSDKVENGNHSYDSIFERQSVMIREAIEWSKINKIDWLIGMDSDEWIECSKNKNDFDPKNQISIQEAIHKEVENDLSIQNIIIENYEPLYQSIQHSSESCFQYSKLVQCSKGNCISYANGKSIGRVSPQLYEFGVHRFGFKNGKEKVANYIRLIHFESCDLEQYIKKYLHLAFNVKQNINYPFEFYNQSIQVAKSDVCKNDLGKNISEISEDCINAFKNLYQKYKIINKR